MGREVCRLAVQRGFSVTSLSRRGENPEPGNKELDQVRLELGGVGFGGDFSYFFKMFLRHGIVWERKR